MASSKGRQSHATIAVEPDLGKRLADAAERRQLSVHDYVDGLLRRALEADEGPSADTQADDRELGAENTELEAFRAGIPDRLTEEERERGLRALAEAKRLRDELAAKYGKFTPESWVLLNESRDERSRQLMGWTDAQPRLES